MQHSREKFGLGGFLSLHRRLQEIVDPDRQRTDRNSVLRSKYVFTLLQNADLAISAAALVRDCSGSCDADSHHMLRHGDDYTKENMLAWTFTNGRLTSEREVV